MHPPKRETFDVVARTNTDPKGIVRDVDVYTEQPWGLYVPDPRRAAGQFHYRESWLLPSLGLRATIFHFNPGHERVQDYYLDVGRFVRNGSIWTRRGSLSGPGGADRLWRCRSPTPTSSPTAIAGGGARGRSPQLRPLHSVFAAVAGLAHHDYDLDRWLATREMALTWRAEGRML